MTERISASVPRGRFDGMWRIVQFNWPLYAAALAVLALSLSVSVFAAAPLLQYTALAAAAGAAWFLLGSLTACHWAYDRSDLHRGAWLDRALASAPTPRRIAVCHCGYDEISALLRTRLPDTSLQLFDHYEEKTMSEPSIHRARRLFPPAAETIPAPHGAWPAEEGAFDAVLGILAIHELRTHQDRTAWFREARRTLAGNGRVVIMEHLRDAASFFAFGPGFMHFHSAATWRRAWEDAGLHCADAFSLTPFLRVFVLQPAAPSPSPSP